MRDGSSLVRPMSNFRISYWARYSMILSKIADKWPESIRCPSASIVSVAAMAAHSSGTVPAEGEPEVSDMASRRAVVKLGIPALIVAGLAVIALWRVGPPPVRNNAIGTTGTEATRVVTAPLAEVAELLANNSVGREAWLEHVQIRQRVGDRYLWIGSGDTRPVFVVLDEGVNRDRDHPIDLSPGQRVTFIGI